MIVVDKGQRGAAVCASDEVCPEVVAHLFGHLSSGWQDVAMRVGEPRTISNDVYLICAPGHQKLVYIDSVSSVHRKPRFLQQTGRLDASCPDQGACLESFARGEAIRLRFCARHALVEDQFDSAFDEFRLGHGSELVVHVGQDLGVRMNQAEAQVLKRQPERGRAAAERDNQRIVGQFAVIRFYELVRQVEALDLRDDDLACGVVKQFLQRQRVPVRVVSRAGHFVQERLERVIRLAVDERKGNAVPIQFQRCSEGIYGCSSRSGDRGSRASAAPSRCASVGVGAVRNEEDEQHEDDEEHDSPAGVTTEDTVHRLCTSLSFDGSLYVGTRDMGWTDARFRSV